MAKVPHGYTTRMVLAAVLALVAAHASRADPQTVALQHASATFDPGASWGSPQPGSFNSWWYLPVAEAGWGLTTGQYGISASGSHLGIAFLPDLMAPPSMENETRLRVSVDVASVDPGRPPNVYEAEAHLSLPIAFQAAPDWRITGYRVTLTGDYLHSETFLNGDLVLSGSLGVDLLGGGHADAAGFTLTDPGTGSDTLSFEALVSPKADFSTFAGLFVGRFVLDPRPPTLPEWEPWWPAGAGSARFEFRSIEIEVLTAPVPEPATALMLGLGATVLAWRHRRRALPSRPA